VSKGGVFLQYFFFVGVVCIIISGISVGAWTTSQQQRATFNTETTAFRRSRTKIAIYSGFLGILSLAISGMMYLKNTLWFFEALETDSIPVGW